MRYDCGEVAGYIEAMSSCRSGRPELAEKLRPQLTTLLK